MREIKTKIKQNADGNFIITDAHSTADIIRWLLTQDSKETILCLLKEEVPQRSWVGLTDEEIWELMYRNVLEADLCRAIEAKLKEKNNV